MKKKIISLVCVLCLVLTLLPVMAFAGTYSSPTLSVAASYDKATNQVTATVTLGAYTDLGGLDFHLKYDNTKLTVSGTPIKGGLLTSNATVSANSDNIGASWSAPDDNGATSAVATEIVKVAFDVKAGQVGAAVFTFDSTVTNFSDKTGDNTSDTPGAGSVLTATATIYSELTGAQAVSITAPVKGATPQSTIAAGTGYTGAITWEGSPTTFAADTAYTANVTLTAESGYKFASTATATVASASSVKDTNVVDDGSTLSFKAVFPATASKDSQTITAVNVDAVYGDTDKSVSATAAGAISYAVKSGSEAYIDVNSSTGALTIKKAGTAYVTVSAAETTQYAAATKDVTINISKAPQAALTISSGNTITFGQTLALSTSGGSGTGAVTYSVTAGTGTATVSESILTPTKAGTVTVTATKAADANYAVSSASAAQTITIAKAAQTINAADVQVTIGKMLTLSAAAEGEVTYAQNTAPSNGTTFNATTGEVNASVATGECSFKVDVSAAATDNYNAAVKTITVSVVNKLSQTITADNVTATYGDTGAKITVTSTNYGAVTYAVTSGASVIDVSAAGAITIKAAGSAVVTVTAAGDDTYAAATKNVSVTVSPKKIAAPTADSKTFTYNGKEQTYTVAANAAYTVTGNKQTNANETGYTVTVALVNKTNTQWADSTTADKTFNFVISKATITITANSKTAYIGDAVPTLNASDYTVTGLASGETLKAAPTLAYSATPDMTKAGTYTITPSGATAPDGGNYNDITYKTGTLTISNKPSAGGGAAASCTLTFNTNGGSAVAAVSKTSGSTVDLTSYKPTRDGYTFAGWFSDTALTKAVTSVKLTADTTVYAKWTQVNPFTDVPDGAYYHDAVLWALSKNVTSGTSPNTFGPSMDCTRAQVVTFLWRAMGSPEPTGKTNPFTDVSPDAYYYKAVLWAVEKGITKGASDTTFAPDDTVTRAQFVTFLWRAANAPAASGTNPFTDVTDTGAYYYNAVLWAVGQGITAGTSATTFGPDDVCNRGQVVTFLCRYMTK